jgi:crotonobetainyl-CoA:carnitine CoA-transferase CaiB-like acyl-CoA transferase
VTGPDGTVVDTVATPIRYLGDGLPAPRYPPRLGADTAGILGELGYPPGLVKDLRERGVLAAEQD